MSSVVRSDFDWEPNPRTRRELACAWALLHAGHPEDGGIGARGLAERASRESLELFAGALLDLNIAGQAAQLLAIVSARAPGDATARYNYAAALRMTGALEMAASECRAALALEPGDVAAFHMLADLAASDELATISQRFERACADRPGDLRLRFALANALEKQGRYHAAFVHLAAAGRIARSSIRYDVQTDLDTIAAIIEAYPQQLPPASAASPSKRPVFILGLPRSGTTLTEQILLRIPGYGSAGEISDLSIIIGNHGRQFLAPPARDRLDLIRRSPKLNLASIGHHYLAMTGRFGSHARLLDKTPFNFLYCGLIAAALPDARMIILRRNSRDNLIGIFRTYFGGLYPYAYDIADLAHYIVAFNQLADHWCRVLPRDRLFELDYQSLATDPENQSKALVSFLGDSWRREILDSGNVRTAVTASAAQVRAPINTSRIGNWQNYAPWIGNALAVLNAGARWRS